MSRNIEFLFDYGSPFSYLASLQLPGFARRNNATVTYRPILLGAVLKATGNQSPMAIPAKSRYMAIELRRWAARYNVPFRPNPHPFLGNTITLMRGAVAAQKHGNFGLYHDLMFKAVWAEALDLGDEAVRGRLLERTGFTPATFAAAIESQEVKDGLRRNTDEAVARGVFGAPAFFVGAEMFWGNDRFDFVEEALRKLS
ncbi:MAG TPA: 2-hydroxychromene-2-carboxylate isomerase [Candidatus Binataceae bacterium]|nr:2-hydroxychromene-2-carboxylate isomerase [Candidatus Binataceae bacterium]